MTSSDIAVDTAMRVTCDREEFAAGLALVARGLSARASVQILSGVRLHVESGRLGLAATDMEISIRTDIETRTGDEGSVVVPGRLLGEIVRLLPDTAVSVEHRVEENTVHISSGPAEYRLRTYPVEDFPRLPDVDGVATSAIATTPFLAAIGYVARAAGRDESRPVLTGILVRFEDNRVVMAATDSYRLSVKESPVRGSGFDLEAIIPARALEEVRRIAAGSEEIEIGVLENHVLFSVAGVWLTTRRIDGQFPDYKKLIPPPEEYTLEVKLPRIELLDVVKRIGVMAQRTSPLRLRFAEGELEVSARTQDVGEAHETLPVSYSGDPLEIGFNADYLRDGIESVGGEEITVKLINPLRPGLVEGPDEGLLYLIMPIRLAG